MSDNQTVWTILWKRAAAGSVQGTPFEISEVVPSVTKALSISEDKAKHLISGLLTELGRLPEGDRFFTREGNAVVPLPEFTVAHGGTGSALEAYPYEL